MKKLRKLSISPEKVIKNEELVNLKGGYNGGTCAAIHEGIILCNISKTDAIFHASCEYSDGTNCEGNWCCDSCSSATWYTC